MAWDEMLTCRNTNEMKMWSLKKSVLYCNPEIGEELNSKELEKPESMMIEGDRRKALERPLREVFDKVLSSFLTTPLIFEQQQSNIFTLHVKSTYYWKCGIALNSRLSGQNDILWYFRLIFLNVVFYCWLGLCFDFINSFIKIKANVS